MVVKVEIRAHDGPGRITRIISADKVLSSPNLINPVNIPIYHSSNPSINSDLGTIHNDHLTLGYLPGLHKFSNFTSEEEVIQSLKSDYLQHLQQLDFITFQLDKASKYRTTSHYPDFILRTANSLDHNFGWIYSQDDTNTNWSNLENFPLMIVGDLSTIYRNQRQAWKLLVELEKNYPLTLKYAPAIPPVLFPLYCYFGIDFFDNLYGELLAQNKVFMDFDNFIEISNIDEFVSTCLCKACEQKESYSSITAYLMDHNAAITESMIRKVQYAIQKGTLRDLVKKYVLIDPNSAALLRIADLDTENNLLQLYNPTIKKHKLLLTSTTDYIRPEIKMFHSRVKERFDIPEWTELVLLIPCSAKKPYSISRSHQLFTSSIKAALRGKRHSVLELIITSPLGVVPRSFEQVYPAGLYDIPVTGNWSELEENIVEDLLLHLFSQLDPSIPIVSYLAEPEKSIIKKFVQKHPDYKVNILDLQESETSNDSLKLLREYLYSLKEKITSTSSKNSYELEFFRGMADYQFGQGAGKVLFPVECEIKRRGYTLMAYYKNNQLATLNLGHLAITVFGAQRLAKSTDKYRVYFADDEISGSALYTPGIVKADEQIRPEDDVLIFSEKSGRFLALGKSHLSGFELVNCSFGLGVSIKKKVKSITK